MLTQLASTMLKRNQQERQKIQTIWSLIKICLFLISCKEGSGKIPLQLPVYPVHTPRSTPGRCERKRRQQSTRVCPRDREQNWATALHVQHITVQNTSLLSPGAAQHYCHVIQQPASISKHPICQETHSSQVLPPKTHTHTPSRRSNLKKGSICYLEEIRKQVLASN